ncbi:MAG: carbohydrate kinase family protein [Anaerolineae bacterium]
MLDVIAAGHLCLDVIPTISIESVESGSFLVPGRITEVGEAVLSGGGSVSNTGLALHRLGATVRLVGRVGDDPIGEITRRVLGGDDERLVEYVRIARGEPGSYTIVLAPPGIDRTFLTSPGPNASFGPDDIDAHLMSQTRIFHLGYPPLLSRMYARGGSALREILQIARANGATTSLDMSMPDPSRPSGQADWRRILARVLPQVDIFAPSAEELLFALRRERFEELNLASRGKSMIDLLRPEDLVDLAATALDMGAGIVLIKVGHRGSYLRTGGMRPPMGRGAPADIDSWQHRELWVPAYSVRVVGTTGAGDATVGGLLLAILRGQSPAQAINSACAVGACNCEAADAVSGIRPWAETQARLSSAWLRIDPQLDKTEWLWDDDAKVFAGPRDSSRAPGTRSG